ncbi:hypothetical protein [uncultured Nostoc sp.]|uniref:hypothetical protein n=1 Tax=uncultured Nostoc sp. TaxID=340711 RepID=UPI00260FBD97|nr:hypothetical protein [uncultured Nostoc sp.]
MLAIPYPKKHAVRDRQFPKSPTGHLTNVGKALAHLRGLKSLQTGEIAFLSIASLF